MPPKFSKNYVSDAKREEQSNLLNGDSDSEDFSTPAAPVDPRRKQRSANDSVHRVRSELDEVVGIMKSNVERVIDRGDRMDELEDKTETLKDGAQMFMRGSRDLRKKMWWQHCKWRLLFILIGVILLLLIIVPLVMKAKK